MCPTEILISCSVVSNFCFIIRVLQSTYCQHVFSEKNLQLSFGSRNCNEALCITGKLDYQAQSPDEAALVGAARNFGFVFKVNDCCCWIMFDLLVTL